jgi:transcriptional regulator with XRE-family HTH domain
MIRPLQVRAARGLLGLSQIELAERAGIGLATLQRLESGGSEIRGSAKSIWKLQESLEEAGIVFIDQNDEHGPGVRLKKPLP